jgi:N-acylneuraminate cytidylyltransferase
MAMVLGMPIVSYPIRTACSIRGAQVAVSTDCPQIAAIARHYGANVIHRPDYLCTDDSDHADVIAHAVSMASESDDQTVVVLLGNTVMVERDLIEESIGMIDAGCDSVCSVWQAQDDHPMRALAIKGKYLVSTGGAARCNRQSYPAAYYYDQGVWTFRARCAFERKGPAPWVWLGQRCRPIVREWLTGRDIHGEMDIEAQEWWLMRRVDHPVDHRSRETGLLLDRPPPRNP